MNGCTFTPELYNSKGKKNRNLDQFIKDQEKYQEMKSYNSQKRLQDRENGETSGF